MTATGRAVPPPAWMDRLLDGLGDIPPSFFSRFLPPDEGGRPSAVLMLFGPSPDGGEDVVLTERSPHLRSHAGQVAFPGGAQDPGDPGPVAAAMREAREEVGLDLDGAGRLLGRLAPTRAIAKGKWLPMTITPFVFHLEGAWTPAINHEVASWFWLPLDETIAGTLDARHEHRLGPMPMTFPCWRHEGHVVWGLTYQMLRSFIDLVAS